MKYSIFTMRRILPEAIKPGISDVAVKTTMFVKFKMPGLTGMNELLMEN